MSNTPTAIEYFNDGAASYEETTGGCTRDVARYILDIAPSFGEDSVVLDNACGNGIVAREILYKTNAGSQKPPTIHCIDGASAMVDLARKALEDTPNSSSVKYETMSGEDISFPSDHFTHSITNMGILFFSDALKGAKGIYRTLKPGGTAIVTSWEELGYLPIIHKAQKAVHPDQPLFRPPISEEWHKASHLEKTLREGGFSDVQVHTKKVHYGAMSVAHMSDLLVQPFSFLTKDWSEDDKARFKVELEKAVEAVAEPFQRPASDGQSGKFEDYVGVPMIALVALAKK